MAIVTFTTDFGTADGYAAMLKGVVLSLAPTAVLVDITHDIPACDVVAGARTLERAAAMFPAGTIHVAVVDPGVGGGRADLVVEASGSCFVGPDNGLLSLAAPEPRKAFRIENKAFLREPISPTFHGRDVFAPTAGRLAAGARASDVGAAIAEIVSLPRVETHPLGDGADAEVIHVDVFGNVVTSLSTAQPVSGVWRLAIDGRSFDAIGVRTYADVMPGGLLVYLGSGGEIEIGVRNGSAAERMHVRRGQVIHLERVS